MTGWLAKEILLPAQATCVAKHVIEDPTASVFVIRKQEMPVGWAFEHEDAVSVFYVNNKIQFIDSMHRIIELAMGYSIP